jgi:hypothetical protein
VMHANRSNSYGNSHRMMSHNPMGPDRITDSVLMRGTTRRYYSTCHSQPNRDSPASVAPRPLTHDAVVYLRMCHVSGAKYRSCLRATRPSQGAVHVDSVVCTAALVIMGANHGLARCGTMRSTTCLSGVESRTSRGVGGGVS